MSAPAVTVAIATVDRGPHLVALVDALLAAPTPAAEIVVVDQTTSHPPEVAARLAGWAADGTVRVLRQRHPSLVRAMNRALRAARAPVVLFVDDDALPRGDLVAAHAAAHAEPGVVAVVGQVLEPGQRPIARRHRPRGRHARPGPWRDLDFRFDSSLPCEVWTAIACNLSVRRAAALAVGGFDGRFVGAAYRFETELARRLRRAGGVVRFEPSASVLHLRAPAGGTRTRLDHRRDPSPHHAVGDYYFGLLESRSRTEWLLWAAARMARAVRTRAHLAHPWWIPPKLVGEVRGLALALRLHRRGPRLLPTGPSEGGGR
ncbi:MAG: glycosyltransferase family 2 protein [Ectothiorhodospiraceae bacterium]|nr:glycosyltransferase family 2 protein [Ectothiorhodospiraceae bacterium]